MDNSKLSYVISAIAPNDITAKMWELRKKFNLDPAFQKHYPDSIITVDHAHLSIKRRFYLKPTAKEEELIAALDNIPKQPIIITAKEIKIIKRERQGTIMAENLVVAIVERSVELQQLHENILIAATPYIETEKEFEGLDYMPHLTLAYSIPDEILNDVKIYAESDFIPVSYTMNSMYVLKNIPGITRERSVVKTYAF